MILTNKAKEDFIDYLWESKFKKEDYKEYEDYIENQKESHTYADIIEWFDSVGIYIEIHYSRILGDKFLCIVNTGANYNLTSYQDSRQESTIQAIIKANKIYNERFKY